MSGLVWSYFASDTVLGESVRLLAVLVVAYLSSWLVCSIVHNALKVWKTRQPNYAPFIKENRRLRRLLEESRRENEHLRKFYRSERPARGSKGDGWRRAA